MIYKFNPSPIDSIKIFIENKHNTLPLSPIYLYDYKKYLLYLENEHTIRF